MGALELPGWPAALPQNLAAAYCGMSVDTFKELCPVQPIAFTDSSKGRRWLKIRLDEWLAKKDPNRQMQRRRFGESFDGDESAAAGA